MADPLDPLAETPGGAVADVPGGILDGAIRMAGRAGWALTDQAISSFTNFALGVLIARSVTAENFGAFSLAFATYLIILNLARAVGTQPLVIRYSAVDPAVWRRGAAAATGTMFAVGVASGLLCIAIGLILGPPAGATFIALGIALPVLLVQDAWRFVFFAGGRDREAVLTDLVWAVTLVTFLLLLAAFAPGTPQAVIGWGASAIIAALVGSRLSGVLPDPAAVRGWLREHSDLVWRYSAEVAIGLGASQVAIYVVGYVAGLAQAGSIRAAAILLGPMHIVLQAAHLIAVPEGVRIRRRSHARFRLATAFLSAGLAMMILAWVLFVSILPDDVGRSLLGDSWDAARSVLFPLGLALVAQGVSGGSLVGLRVLADASSSLQARILDSGFSLIFGVGGALLGGAVGAAWGIAAGEWAGALIFLAAFVRSERRHRDVPTP
jgi:O-antigen/teichoic acid export membrane protein